ncbi:MAG: exopolysaccharide biosynthesis protein [Acidobacteriaceae bacterium]|nr:exopolysaccharide biosynthesis protein [Acidobacteriaceae bacterium]MBV9779043.1 exopolysaccharide biosynthesis protein [Acidobacteriaceae bacterium]
MIDIHSHVLPGVDDGARTLEESVEMLRLAAASGTTDIVATPHASPEFTFDSQRVRSFYRELSDKCKAFISLHLGCDFHLSYANLVDALRAPQKYTINQGKYLMVELPELVAFGSVREGLNQLIRAGITPIITHPERNMSLQHKRDELLRWVKDGCLVQVTAQSFLGRFGPAAKNSAEKLMNAELVHFIASDAHDCVDRTPDLSAAYKYISSKYSPERAELLFISNPFCVLHGEPVSSNLPRESKISTLFALSK